jgi:hypothetical protein
MHRGTGSGLPALASMRIFVASKSWEASLNHLFLGAVAFGVTLLVASFLLGGKDTDHGGSGHDHSGGGATLGWAPVTSLRFWVFVFTFGGAAGLALTQLGSGDVVSAVGAGAVGWLSGAIAVTIVRKLSKGSVSSDVVAADIVGVSGTLVLPVGVDKPGKVRVDIKGRSEDFVAFLVEDGPELPTGTPVLVISRGEQGSVLVQAEGRLK